MAFLAASLRQSLRPHSSLRSSSAIHRAVATPSVARLPNVARYSTEHDAETYPVFNQRYAQFFNGVEDLFELQRGLNNCFAYDLVPAVPTVEAALRAARRVNDLPTAVRIFEGLKEKVENKSQYQAYLDETQSLREELGIQTKEELYGQSL